MYIHLFYRKCVDIHILIDISRIIHNNNHNKIKSLQKLKINHSKSCLRKFINNYFSIIACE